MTSAAPSERPSSRVLSESWATLSASDAHSEDGTRSEQTDLASLIDQTSVDEVASLDDQDRYSNSEMGGNYEDHVEVNDGANEDEDEDEDDDETDGESDSSDGGDNQGVYLGQESVSESQELPMLYHRFGHAADDSGLTTKSTGFRQSADSSIEFIEPANWPEANQVDLKHTVHIFDDAEAAKLKEKLSCDPEHSVLSVTVQQTVTKQGLDVDQPFRVLYVGNPDYRNAILDKIGDVLVSNSRSSFDSTSTGSSRYHVIPTSFGAGAVPNFAELLPIHLQLIVDECLEATAYSQFGKPSNMNLRFKNRPSCSSYWAGSEYRVSSTSKWVLPNVAIFFISSKDDGTALETQQTARAFMERHGVPAMIISETPLWATASDSIPLNNHSLHMCLESRNPQNGETAVVRRYPIDLQTFESITPGQLNRNLASLASAKSPGLGAGASKFSMWRSLAALVKNDHYTNTQDLSSFIRLLVMATVLIVASSLGYTALTTVFVALSRLFSRPDASSLAPSSSSSVHTANVFPVDDSRHSVQHLPSNDFQLLGNQAEDRSHLEELMGLALSSQARDDESPDAFELQVIGDCHVILKPPHWFLNTKKQPKFSVDVMRHESHLPYELSKLFDGVYALKVDREHAHGLVNVTISSASKPPVQQTTLVDFGTPWLKIANWKRAASAISSQFVKDLAVAQTSLSRAYNRLSTDLQVVVGDVVKRSHFLRQEADIIRHGSTQLSSDAKSAALSRSKELSEVVQRTAVQPFWAVCSAFQERRGNINTEAKGLILGTWGRISEISSPSVGLGGMMDRIRSKESLGKAQKRARRLVRNKKCHRSEHSKMHGHQKCQ